MKRYWLLLMAFSAVLWVACSPAAAPPDTAENVLAEPVEAAEVAAEPEASAETEAVESAESAEVAEEVVESTEATDATESDELADMVEAVESETVPVGQTAEGAFYKGQPDAPIKLYDYSNFL